MFSKKYMGFLIFLILIISLGVVSAENNTVNEKNFNDVQIAIDNAGENETINLADTYIGNNEIKISKDIIIEGDAIFDAQNSSRIINAKDNNVIFKKLTFINGNAQKIDYYENGGAVIGSGILTFENCKFIGNNAHTGGAVYVTNTSIFINCTFINNHAEIGGAIGHECMEDNQKEGTLFINNTHFYNNTAKTEGGAIFSQTYNYDIETNKETFKDISIINSNFINNNASIGGGAYISSNALITNSTFSKNKVTEYKGMIDGYYTIVDAFGSALITICTETIIKNSTFTDNLGDYSAVSIANGIGEITNSTFKNNTYGSVLISADSTTIINNKSYSNTFFKDNFTQIQPIILSVSSLTTNYLSGKTLKITLTNAFTKKGIDETNVIIKVYTNKKYKLYELSTNSKGIVNFKASKLNAGTHKVIILNENFYQTQKQITIKIKKAKTTVNAPKVTNKYKKSQYFKVSVKAYKKPVKNTLIKIKIDKKTYKIKTNSKGIAKINTKILKVGKHNVLITSGDSNYQISKKAKIIIKK